MERDGAVVRLGATRRARTWEILVGAVGDSREEGWERYQDWQERRERCSWGFAGSEKSHPLVGNLLGFAGGIAVQVAVGSVVKNWEDIEV